MIIEPSQPIYSIAELNSKARLLLETHLGTVWIIGELSNLATPSSGHLYFTLKDSHAQVRCAFFRANRSRMAFLPANGQQVIARANVSLYETRGDYQLIITEMQLAGDGALQIAFEKLKQKLQNEGLFDASLKKIIPKFPRTIGVITSPSGAAIHDILKVLYHRNPFIPVIIYPSAVQGNDAKMQLVTAIELANKRRECDVLILARGGGSLEDLWSFNEEIVARAVVASDIPIVTGVGHEIDFTIADFASDHRAPTPSAAAEYVSTDQSDIFQKLNYFEQHLHRCLQHILQSCQYHLNQLKTRLRHPGDRLREQTQRLDYLEQTLLFSIKTLLTDKAALLTQLENQLIKKNPIQKIERYQYQLEQLSTTLHYNTQTALVKKQDQLVSLSQQLNALSPLATLQRGYAIITDTQGNLVKSTHTIKEHDKLFIRLHDGIAECLVTINNHQTLPNL